MTAPGSFRVSDVPYDHVSGLLARLYVPGAPIGAVVDVHGGGWVSGSRLDNASIAEALAAAGILVMSIDFRMPPDAVYPASIADTHLAIRWLKSVASTFGLSADQVGGLGTSSGGHQLLLAYLCQDDPRYAASPLPEAFAWDYADDGPLAALKDQDAALAFAILGWPVADPLERYRMVVANKNQQLLDAHHAYWPEEAEMAEGNPQRILQGMPHANLPPLLVLQGGADMNLPDGSADRLAAAYRAAGGVVQLSTFAEAPHAFVTRDAESAAARQAMQEIVDFAVVESTRSRS